MNDISLRDYFAAHAPEMPSWYQNNTAWSALQSDIAALISWRYAYADAMLEKRKEHNPQFTAVTDITFP